MDFAHSQSAAALYRYAYRRKWPSAVGGGSRTNLYYRFQRNYNYPPSQERENADHDRLWKYRIIE